MFGKVLGCSLLIIGTSIGAGMLALPVVTAAGGFYHSTILFIGAWLVTVIGAYFILEVNLWLPENANLISMAGKTLGPIGKIATWFIYLLLLYSLLAAYTSGGADLIRSFFIQWHWPIYTWLAALVFLIILGTVVFNGVKTVDLTNRGLMFVKLAGFFLLTGLILPHIVFSRLSGGHIQLLAGAIMIVITAFGYATIIPSLRYYFNSNVKALRLTIAIGSICSLLIYVFWDFTIQGTIRSSGPQGLINMASSGHTASRLTAALSHITNSSAISDLAHLFTSICVTTSFLGVALCLTDFYTDGLRLSRKPAAKLWVALLAYLPPLLIVIFYPQTFIIGLSFAGILCVLLLLLLPALMVFSGRYIKKISHGYAVWGGKSLIIFEIILSVLLLIYGIYDLH